MAKQCILILGGARGGKSSFAKDIAPDFGDRVLFVATGEALDEEMRQRIEEHKKERPPNWRSLEVPTGIGKRIQEESDDAQVVIVDCLTLLVANVIGQCGDDPEQTAAEKRVAAETDELIAAINSSAATWLWPGRPGLERSSLSNRGGL